jgi:folate-binding Fe-S cluster repair protein YgfZ
VHGDVISLNGKTVGWIGTAVRHYEDGMIALALLKRNVGVGEELLVEHDSIVITAVEDAAPTRW